MTQETNDMRNIVMTKDFIKHPEGSVLIEVGDTKVICNVSVEDRVPPFLRNKGQGWITAEYQMLPRATEQRNIREAARGKLSGRTMEIQRLIGRALRTIVDLEKIGERTLWVDCDVIQADGGTRTAAITGAYVALVLAMERMLKDEKIKQLPITDFLAATSVGVLPSGEAVLDLDYEKDASAYVDMNIVMTGSGEFIEIQGTGEEAPFSRKQLNELLDLAEEGIRKIIDIQKEVLGEVADRIGETVKQSS